MKPGGGKLKGGQFERLVARQLSKALYNDPNALWRTRSSGAKKEHPGDICPAKSNIYFPFVIECKDDKRFSLDDFFRHKKNNLIIEWWKKLINDMNQAGPLYSGFTPLLIITKKYYPTLAISNECHQLLCLVKNCTSLTLDYDETSDFLFIVAFEDLLDFFSKKRETQSEVNEDLK